ncbi:U2 snRNP complex subunit msl1 [Mycoblastus sanguinarius]|nr:U2 snRNP complex subunit msl1 [Mycoblastus sanguinarius]
MAAKAMPSHDGPPTKSTAPPNQTLYLTNLPEKITKPDLRISLYTLFSTYGPVLDVVAMKNSKMRGQAHIAFRDVQASTQAMRALHGFDFFGKEMKIQFAKGKSDTIAKLDGTYRMHITAGNEVTTTALQQSIFGAPPSSLPAPVQAPAPSAKTPEAAIANGGMETDQEGARPQGVKRGREEESDDEGAPMEEDSDAPMEASSEDDE